MNGRPFLEFGLDDSRRRLIISLSLLLKSSLTAFWRCFSQFDHITHCFEDGEILHMQILRPSEMYLGVGNLVNPATIFKSPVQTDLNSGGSDG